MNIQTSGLKTAIENLRAVEEKLKSMPIHESPNIDDLCEQYSEKFKVLQIKWYKLSSQLKAYLIDQHFI